MLVNTAVFGPLEVPAEHVFAMPNGLYGFDEAGDYALITKRDDDVTLMWYQAIGEGVPCFVVFNPFEIIDGYNPIIEPSDLKALGLKSGDKPKDELIFLVIAVVPEDISKITVNLKSPIAINPKKKIARQVILSNKEYPIKFYLVEGQEQEDK